MRLGALIVLGVLTLTSCGSSGGSSSSAGSQLPGGSTGKSVLAEHNFLDKSDRVYYPESAPDGDVQAAICSYLFGSPSEVAETADLDGRVTLDKDSGFRNAGGGGIGFQCGYDVSGKAEFALVLWTKDVSGGSQADKPLVDKKLYDDLYGYAGYLPDHSGKQVARTTVTGWLTAAGKRVARG